MTDRDPSGIYALLHMTRHLEYWPADEYDEWAFNALDFADEYEMRSLVLYTEQLRQGIISDADFTDDVRRGGGVAHYLPLDQYKDLFILTAGFAEHALANPTYDGKRKRMPRTTRLKPR